MGGAGDASLRRLKGEHLKKRADQALHDGNYRAAWETYNEAIEVHPDKDVLRALYSNCSLAYAKAQRFQDALTAANKTIELAPTWTKGHWRRGAALLGLRDIPGAVKAFYTAWAQNHDSECYQKLEHVAKRLTREQLGVAILELFQDLVENGTMRRPELEATDKVAMQEAAFRLISLAHRGYRTDGPYFLSFLRWMTQEIDPGEAYSVRAAIHINAKCYLQARADAEAAIEILFNKLYKLGNSEAAGEQAGGGIKQAESSSNITLPSSERTIEGADEHQNKEKGEEKSTQPLHKPSIQGEKITLSTKDELTAALSAAYLRLGEAYLAERGHADRDPVGAFKAFTRATEYNSISQELRDRLHEATEELTKEQVERAAMEVYNESRPVPGTAGAAGGPLHPGERVFRVEVVLAFPQGTPANLKSGVREAMRQALGAAAGVGTAAVTLEGVRPARPPTRPALEIIAHVTVGPRILQGNALVKALGSGDQAQVERFIGGTEVTEALGAPNPALCRAEMIDITPRGEDKDSSAAENSGTREERQLVVPSRPKLELEVPYKMYRLVTSTGGAVERTDKHPFAMSRVYYDAAEKPEEVWVELADGSCRWRQTAGEVRVLALKVPRDLRPRDLSVQINPFDLQITNKVSGEVYLKGRLHRGVVPEDCFWTHCGGEGEDGCCVTLRKMNLEVLQRHWAHSETWWTRLFEVHGEIAWDDYEKDYSDLPEEVMVKHKVAEAIKDVERRIENNERTKREALQEADDLRKRRRQERLNVLRSGGALQIVGSTRIHRPARLYPPPPPPPPPHRPYGVTIVDVVLTANLTSFYIALNTTGYINRMNNNFKGTVFAPTNQAFEALAVSMNVTERELLTNRFLMKNLIAYHIIQSEVLKKDELNALQTHLTYLNGAYLTIYKSRYGPVRILFGELLIKGNGFDYDGFASVVKPDLESNRGVLHVIDRVLMPPRGEVR